MNGKLVAILRHAHEFVDVGAIETGVHALAVEVHRQRHDIDIAGALAIAEQRAFHAVSARQKAQLGGGHGAAAVIVRVKRNQHAVALLDVAAEPLDLIRVDIWRRHFNRRRQIEDQLLLRCWLVTVDHRLANVLGEFQFGAGEALGRIFMADHILHAIFLLELANERCALHRDVDDARLVQLEHHAALQFGGRIVQMHDSALHALQRLEGAADQFLARLGEHLNGHAIGDLVVLDQEADEIEIRLRGGREAHLDLLEAHFQQRIEHAHLAVMAHRLDQRLIAVTQVNRAPHGGLRDGAVRPLPVGQVHGRKRAVFFAGGNHHVGLSFGMPGLAGVFRYQPPESQGICPAGPQGQLRRRRPSASGSAWAAGKNRMFRALDMWTDIEQVPAACNPPVQWPMARRTSRQSGCSTSQPACSGGAPVSGQR